MRIVHGFFPLGDPARQAADGEHYREHVGGDADGPQHDAAVEIHVGIEVVVDKIGIPERHLLEFLGDVQEGVFKIERAEQLIAHALHDLGPGVVSLVDPVAETHEPEGIVLVLGARDGFFIVPASLVDLVQHVDHGLVGSAVQGPPERRNAR